MLISSISSNDWYFKTTLLTFLKCLIWCFMKGLRGNQDFGPSCISFKSRSLAGNPLRWKVHHRMWLSCICSLLHLPRTSDGTKAPGRWAEGRPNASVTTPSLLHHALLPWLAVHSPRADVGPQLQELGNMLTSGLSSFIHSFLSLDGLSRAGIGHNSGICSVLRDTQWCVLKICQPFPVAWSYKFPGPPSASLGLPSGGILISPNIHRGLSDQLVGHAPRALLLQCNLYTSRTHICWVPRTRFGELDPTPLFLQLFQFKDLFTCS